MPTYGKRTESPGNRRSPRGGLRRLHPNIEHVSFGHVRLWLDDLIKIERIISGACPDYSYSVTADDWALDSISDLEKLVESHVAKLRIR